MEFDDLTLLVAQGRLHPREPGAETVGSSRRSSPRCVPGRPILLDQLVASTHDHFVLQAAEGFLVPLHMGLGPYVGGDDRLSVGGVGCAVRRHLLVEDAALPFSSARRVCSRICGQSPFPASSAMTISSRIPEGRALSARTYPTRAYSW
ncbi:hypothetical protein ACWCPF_44065 [Streptomyces sp. NPDC001858]